MKILFNKTFLDHNLGSIYEGDYRLDAFKSFSDSEGDGEPFLSLVHSPEYIENIKNSCLNCESIAEAKLSPASFNAACVAVGISLKAAEQMDFAVIRPPGHHASRDKASGFCLFNNVAIASQKLASEGKKVFILDIDGHHGDGTQWIFYQSKQVFYCSIHQQNSYPYTGTFLEFGAGEGIGYTLNIPIPENSGEKEFLQAVNKAISAGIKFQPDVVAVSAGFDGYRKDRLLNLNFSLHAFYECGYQLSKAFKNIFGVLEGGYHEDLKECIETFVDGINKGAMPTKIKWDPDLSIG